eukprot:scaffold100200_cov38-Prasinocladus_malaysianus.AAC.1
MHMDDRSSHHSNKQWDRWRACCRVGPTPEQLERAGPDVALDVASGLELGYNSDVSEKVVVGVEEVHVDYDCPGVA